MTYSLRREFVVSTDGKMRQAGTVDPHDEFVDAWREMCEQSLFVFTYLVLGRTYLTPTLHMPVCNWLQKTPAYRKMLLLPRRHAKTSIVSHGLPLHILIQPENGLYMPEKAGSDCRILLVGETDTRATDNLRVLRNVLTSNMLFRAFWPHLIWDNPRRESDKWNEKELIIPRKENYPDPSIRATGVGSAIVGARHDVHIKDDLVSEEAANSEVVMDTVIRWHKNSRALFDSPGKSLEFIIGTRWAVHDLYSSILTEDPTVDYVIRSIVEGGVPIYPEVFSLDDVDRLDREFGIMFPLLYMNNVGDPQLIDFHETELRFFELAEETCSFEVDPRDADLIEKYGAPPKPVDVGEGKPLDWTLLGRRAAYLNAKAG